MPLKELSLVLSFLLCKIKFGIHKKDKRIPNIEIKAI